MLRAIKSFTLLLALWLVSCNSKETVVVIPSDLSEDAFLRVIDHEGDNTYIVEEACYGLYRYPYGYELTFHLSSRSSSEMNQSPNYEVSILMADKPILSADSLWKNQPGEVDHPDLGIMSNFYKFGHDYFDDFTVSVIDIRGDDLLCEIEGSVDASQYVIKSRALFRADGWNRDEAGEPTAKVVPLFK